MYKDYVLFSCLLGYIVSVLTRLAQARIFFSLLCFRDDYILLYEIHLFILVSSFDTVAQSSLLYKPASLRSIFII